MTATTTTTTDMLVIIKTETQDLPQYKKLYILLKSVVLTSLVFCVIYLMTQTELTRNAIYTHTYHTSSIKENIKLVQKNLTDDERFRGYLISTPNCKIPQIDPFDNEIMKYHHRMDDNQNRCADEEKDLTRVEYNETNQRYTLRIIKPNIKYFTQTEFVDCCYQTIQRSGIKKFVDSKVQLSRCLYFNKEIQLEPTYDSILVECSVDGETVYINGHAMMPERAYIRERIKKWKTKDAENQQQQHRPMSVLMLGIDSLSRNNLIRAMPKTAEYLYNNEWFELSGYNKIDDNTFPNLMAVLTGLNGRLVEQKCKPDNVEYLDNCANAFIWQTFREHGYVTAFGEDLTAINVFNLKSRGFLREPVDYYLRPFLLVAEHRADIFENSFRCSYADYIFDYAHELARRFPNDPYFGLFWMNSFSHNDFNGPTSMDERIAKRLQNLMTLEAFNNTIVIFFSDHGLRYGPVLATLSGFYEDRLPAMFIWLPKHLRKSHPKFVDALNVNRQRLTNHYDLHMTLKHVLALSKRVTSPSVLAPAESCPRCQTLLAPVPLERTCEDIAIEQHWCTCFHIQRIDIDTKIVEDMVNLTIEHMNYKVRTFKDGAWLNVCKRLTLRNIEKAYQVEYAHAQRRNANVGTYRLQFKTAPSHGHFSATVEYNQTNGNFKILGDITRLSAYAKDARCIVYPLEEKKYCVCAQNKLDYTH